MTPFHFYVVCKYHHPWERAVWSDWCKSDSCPRQCAGPPGLVWLPDVCRACRGGSEEGQPFFLVPPLHSTWEMKQAYVPGKGGRTRCLWLSVSTYFPNVSTPYSVQAPCLKDTQYLSFLGISFQLPAPGFLVSWKSSRRRVWWMGWLCFYSQEVSKIHEQINE